MEESNRTETGGRIEADVEGKLDSIELLSARPRSCKHVTLGVPITSTGQTPL